MNKIKTVNFIPAQKSPLFTSLFKIYTKGLFKRRFKKIWIHQDYKPSPESRTVYFLNHTSWWDGLIPLILNKYRFKQHARAMMEHKQMQRYWFFKWLGAFSIKPDDRAHTLASLRYAVQSMQRNHSSLFIYPEGEIVPAGSELHFKPGIGWLYTQLPPADFVPVGIHIHTMRYDKPELHIWVGNKLNINPKTDIQQITHACQENMRTVLEQLWQTAGFDDSIYKAFF